MYNIETDLAALAGQGLSRTRRVVAGPQGPFLEVDGQRYLAFCSNDYLGLASHPDITAAAIAGARRTGVGAGASALVSGHGADHEALEHQLAAFVGLPRALLFGNGYMANLGAITALVGAGDTVFVDRLCHASLIDGARLSRASFKVYPHCDLARLDALLGRCDSLRKLVLTDAVFSMDGDIAPLPALAQLCRRHGAWLLVDDAHGLGVLGPEGRGSVAHFGLDTDGLLYMGTLGKAVGVAGAFVAGREDLVQWLMQRARTYMFTTANPALLAAATSASLQRVAQDEWRRQALREHIDYLSRRLVGLPWRLMPSSTAIQPLLVGDNHQTRALARALQQRGLWVPAICPPTVPSGTARLRISLSAAHTRAHLAQLADALQAIAAEWTEAAA